jgi:hypothetical protein
MAGLCAEWEMHTPLNGQSRPGGLKMILNLTQHIAFHEQVSVGVIEPTDKLNVQKLLTFDDLPSQEELRERASQLADAAAQAKVKAAMIGGAPFFMGHLERALKERGVRPLYAFSQRESVDEKQPDGSTKKVGVFRHIGWVEA